MDQAIAGTVKFRAWAWGWLFAALSLCADEQVILESYDHADWHQFTNRQQYSCFIDSQGGFQVLYSLEQESDFSQAFLKRYLPGAENSGGPITDYGPGAWYQPRLNRMTGSSVELQLERGSDYFPMPIGHQIKTISFAATWSTSDQYPRIVFDSAFSHLRKIDDSTAAGFCVDYAQYENEVLRFLTQVELSGQSPNESPENPLTADTVWTASTPVTKVLDLRFDAQDLWLALFSTYDQENWGLVCIQNDELRLEIDSLFSLPVSNLRLSKLTDSVIISWRAGVELNYQVLDLSTLELEAPQTYFSGEMGSLLAVSRYEVQFDEDQIYLQLPFLHDSSHSEPDNWAALNRIVINRSTNTVTDEQTLYIFPQGLTFAAHRIAVFDGIMHSLIVTNDGTRSQLEYFGPLNLVHLAPQIAGPDDQDLVRFYPNPFNLSTRISFRLETPGDLTLRIYNLRGELISRRVLENLGPGRQSMILDHHLFQSGSVGSGVYLVSLQSSGWIRSQKILLLK